MSVVAGHAGSFKSATALYASEGGEWVQVPLGGSAGWTRPAEWLTTNVGVGEQKVQIIAALSADTTREMPRWFVMQIQGAYTVDWGDGTAPANYASNAIASHAYVAANLSGNPLTAEGDLQALITITPQAGQTLTYMIYNAAPTGYTGKTWRPPLLELVIGPASMVGVNLSAICNLLQRVEFKSAMTFATTTSMFLSCYSLHEIVGNITITGNSTSGMFSGCYNLTKFPTLTLTGTGINALSMFLNCSSMVEPPSFSCSQITNMTTIFSGCGMMRRVFSGFDTPVCTTLASAFLNCFVLESLPLLNTNLVTSFISAFANCSNLRHVSFTSTAAVTSMQNAFQAAGMIEELLNLDMGLCPNSTAVGAFVNNLRLSKLTFVAGKGPAFTTALTNMYLDAAALNAVYTALPTVTAQTLTVTNIPGTIGDDPSIATAKGWTVTGS